MESRTCAAVGCENTAKSQCPQCAKLRLKPTLFCSQGCFKKSWKEHKKIHKVAVDSVNFQPPPFNYTGEIRPHYVTPMRDVPSHVKRPDYAISGIPHSEQQAKADRKIKIHTKEEIERMRKACKIAREALDVGASMIAPGITTEEIDLAIHNAIVERGAYPSPLNYYGFPKSCCTSENEKICHGIPDARPLQDGDILNIDVTAYFEGMHADLNETHCVGTKTSDKHKRLVKCSYDALAKSIEHVKPGVFVREFGNIISKFVRKCGFSVVKTYCGHGIGELFHCAPNVPHYAKNKAIGVCKPGMIFTIEPMINAGSWRDVTWPDEWTSTTCDGEWSAQFEHTMLVTDAGVEVLTARTKKSRPFYWEQDENSESQIQ